MSPVEAALAIAAAHGLPAPRATVLRDMGNTVVRIDADGGPPVVARVARTTAQLRGGDPLGHVAREVAVGAFLAAAGAPCVAPATRLPPGPHRVGRQHLSFWTFVDHDPERAVPAEAVGRALATIHGHLAGCDLPVPPLDPLAEVGMLLDHVAEQHALDVDDLARLRRSARRLRLLQGAAMGRPLQVLHGDAHASNLLRTPDGVLWTDFEDAVRGPLGWDLACLATASRFWGPPDAGIEAAIAAYGPLPPDLDDWIAVRALHVLAWNVAFAHHHGDGREKVTQRLAHWRKYADARGL